MSFSQSSENKNATCPTRGVCVNVAYLCTHKSNTIMIDVLEDEVALETDKYKMPYIHSQMENL